VNRRGFLSGLLSAAVAAAARIYPASSSVLMATSPALVYGRSPGSELREALGALRAAVVESDRAARAELLTRMDEALKRIPDLKTAKCAVVYRLKA
jgi:hypothetical protein